MSETQWNGEPCTAARVTVTVADDGVFPMYWARDLVGTRRKAVRVEYGGQDFYLDDEDGSGWNKVTHGGSPHWAHSSLDVEPGSVEPRPAPDLRADLEALRDKLAAGPAPASAAERFEALIRIVGEHADALALVERQRDEARQWARHGYEIGQRHCGWSDHGVAPAWLTEGWPPHFASCEHLQQLTRAEAAIACVREALTNTFMAGPDAVVVVRAADVRAALAGPDTAADIRADNSGPEAANTQASDSEPVDNMADTAQSGIRTPGCNCGHHGMGLRWHASDCAWRAHVAITELAQAIRLMREYVGEELLPSIEGWSWYDALRRHAPHELPAPADAPKEG